MASQYYGAYHCEELFFINPRLRTCSNDLPAVICDPPLTCG